ncbi:hypothetical protein ABTK10_20410, partial [Acinetobacter baumannii]
MWQTVKTNNLKNKGINIWIYEPNDKVFAGVELYDSPNQGTALENKIVDLPKYAYHKHVGPYSLLKEAGQNMRAELKAKG